MDPKVRWTVESRRFLSKSRNMPFEGWELVGRATLKVVGGRGVWELT
jgi:dihydroorotase